MAEIHDIKHGATRHAVQALSDAIADLSARLEALEAAAETPKQGAGRSKAPAKAKEAEK